MAFSVIATIHLAKAQDSTYFSDNFDGSSVDTSKWQVQEQNVDLSGNPAYGGNVTVANSYLYMSSNGSAFPFIQTVNNPFPASGDFVLQFSLQYTCIADWGDGLMVGNGTPTLDPTGTGNYAWHNKIFDVWAADNGDVKYDPSTGTWQSNLTNIYIELLNQEVYKLDVSGFKPSSPEQTYELAYVNGTYTVYVNGIQVAQAQSDIRPTTILIGEPPIFDLPQSPQNMADWGSWWGWSCFQMNYVTVQQTSNPASPTPTPIPTAESSNQTQTVFSIDSNSTVSDFAFNSTSEELFFTVRGPSGTTGYMNITISTTLLPDTSGLIIYIDNQEVNFTTTTFGDTQQIYFTYHHSTHQVAMYLPTNETASQLQLWVKVPSLVDNPSINTSMAGHTSPSSWLQIVYGVVAAVAIVTAITFALVLTINDRKTKSKQQSQSIDKS